MPTATPPAQHTPPPESPDANTGGISGTVTLAPGGAAYIKLDVPFITSGPGGLPPGLPSGPPMFGGFGGSSGGLTVHVTGDPSIPFRVSVLPYYEAFGPGADQECSRTSDAGSTNGNVNLSGLANGCDSAIAVITRSDVGSAGTLGTAASDSTDLTWTAYSTGTSGGAT